MGTKYSYGWDDTLPAKDTNWFEGNASQVTTHLTFPPFKFEQRRTRIDWRLLHGVDSNSVIRDTDVDTLEKCVHVLAFGDIEAEDTLHLTEINFIKIFRLAQLTIEYLLYVQDCLSRHNEQLLQQISAESKHMHVLRVRAREQYMQLKHAKRELRRASRTNRYYEIMFDEQQQKQTLLLSQAGTFNQSQPPAKGTLGKTGGSNMAAQTWGGANLGQTWTETHAPADSTHEQKTEPLTHKVQDEDELQQLQEQLARALQLVNNYDKQQKELVALAQKLVQQQQQQQQQNLSHQPAMHTGLTTSFHQSLEQSDVGAARQPTSPIYEWDNRDEVVQRQQEEIAEMSEELRRRSHLNTELMLQVQKNKRELERMQHENRCFKIVLDAKDNGNFTRKIQEIVAELEAERELAKAAAKEPNRIRELEFQLEQSRAECLDLSDRVEQLGAELRTAEAMQQAAEEDRNKYEDMVAERDVKIDELSDMIGQLEQALEAKQAATEVTSEVPEAGKQPTQAAITSAEATPKEENNDGVDAAWEVIRVSAKKKPPGSNESTDQLPTSQGALNQDDQDTITGLQAKCQTVEKQLSAVCKERDQLKEEVEVLQREVAELSESHLYLQTALEDARNGNPPAAPYKSPSKGRAGQAQAKSPLKKGLAAKEGGKGGASAGVQPKQASDKTTSPSKMQQLPKAVGTPPRRISTSPRKDDVPYTQESPTSSGQTLESGWEQKAEPNQSSSDSPLPPHPSLPSYSSQSTAPASMPSFARRNLQQKAAELSPSYVQQEIAQLDNYTWNPSVPSQQVMSTLSRQYPYSLPDNPAVLMARPAPKMVREELGRIHREVQEDVVDALWSFGVDPNLGELTDEEYVVAMSMLRQQQAEMEANQSPEVLKYMRQLRSALSYHLFQSARQQEAMQPSPAATPVASLGPSPAITPEPGRSPDRRRSRLEVVSRPDTPVSPLRQALAQNTQDPGRSPAQPMNKYRAADPPDFGDEDDDERGVAGSGPSRDGDMVRNHGQESDRAQHRSLPTPELGPESSLGQQQQQNALQGMSPLRSQRPHLPANYESSQASSRQAQGHRPAYQSSNPRSAGPGSGPHPGTWQAKAHDSDTERGTYSNTRQQDGNSYESEDEDGNEDEDIEELEDEEQEQEEKDEDEQENRKSEHKVIVVQKGANGLKKERDKQSNMPKLETIPSGGWAKETLPRDLAEEESVDVESIHSFGSGASSPVVAGGWVADSLRKATPPAARSRTPPNMTPVQYGLGGDFKTGKRPDSAASTRPIGAFQKQTSSNAHQFDDDDDDDDDSLDFLEA